MLCISYVSLLFLCTWEAEETHTIDKSFLNDFAINEKAIQEPVWESDQTLW